MWHDLVPAGDRAPSLSFLNRILDSVSFHFSRALNTLLSSFASALPLPRALLVLFLSVACHRAPTSNFLEKSY